MARDAPFQTGVQKARKAPSRRNQPVAKRAPNALAGDGPNPLQSARQSEPKMPRLRLPNRLEREKTREPSSRECPAHRAWVRRHHCCVPGCLGRPIECAHVRRDTDGGVALKPSDCWSISLCRDHHLEQHQVGELAFERRYGVDLRELALLFAGRSPHRKLLRSRRG